MDPIALGLPNALTILTDLRSMSESEPISDVKVMTVYETIFSLFAHAAALAESIAQDALIVRTPDLSSDNSSAHLDAMHQRTELLQSLRQLQSQLEQQLADCVERMTFKPRLFRLADHLGLSSGEIRAFVFIVLSCAGVEGPGSEDHRSGYRSRSELFNCREFARLEPYQLLDFLSPSRKHFSQGLVEVDEEFATSYTESKFRSPREVLKAIYGGTLTVDEAMTLGASALADVLAEEPGSVLGADSSILIAPIESVPGIKDVSVEDKFAVQSNRNRTTDNSDMIDLLSELRVEDDQRVTFNSHDTNSRQVVHVPDANVNASPKPLNASGYATETSSLDDGSTAEADILPYQDNMEYLKDGFEVVQEACKVYNFRERNSEEDRYTSTKRPVEAMQREADAKLRKATAHFTRRLNKTKQIGEFMPRLELLIAKLRLAHFERMVILTLGTFTNWSPNAMPLCIAHK